MGCGTSTAIDRRSLPSNRNASTGSEENDVKSTTAIHVRVGLTPSNEKESSKNYLESEKRSKRAVSHETKAGFSMTNVKDESMSFKIDKDYNTAE